MKVILLEATPDPEKLIAMAARLCYSNASLDDLREKITDEVSEKLLNKLSQMHHESPIEHASFTFAAEGVSRTLTHQLVRHRLASYSQQSQRYVELEDFPYVIPPAIDKNPVARKHFIESMENAARAYSKIVEALKEDYANETNAQKKSIEDARYVFPNACETKIIFTMNARSLKNFFRLRCCERAQWEIKNMAVKMLKLLRERYPILFKDFGPPCLNGFCTEGSLSCGRASEIRAFFKNL